MGKDRDEMEDVESISPEQAKKEMREAVKHVHEEEGKHPKSSSSKEHGTSSKGHSTSSKQHDTAQKGDMEDVETISPEQAKKEMREAAQRVQKDEGKKKK
jgi:hypothetical protein